VENSIKHLKSNEVPIMFCFEFVGGAGMGYKNKTYVIFDGDNDIWAYGFMKGWKQSEHVDFDFHDAHDLRVITVGASEEAVKRTLRERLKNSKQAIVLIGESTKNLFRFVRWEIETCLEMGIPIIAVNLNNLRKMDQALCPPILKGTPTVHVAFKARIIQKALDDLGDNFAANKAKSDMCYEEKTYRDLGL
jgi:MTH538 TIR-like domain (DUF1863)